MWPGLDKHACCSLWRQENGFHLSWCLILECNHPHKIAPWNWSCPCSTYFFFRWNVHVDRRIRDAGTSDLWQCLQCLQCLQLVWLVICLIMADSKFSLHRLFMAFLKAQYSFNGSMSSSGAFVIWENPTWSRVGSSCLHLRSEIIGDSLMPKVSTFTGDFFGNP